MRFFSYEGNASVKDGASIEGLEGIRVSKSNPPETKTGEMIMSGSLRLEKGGAVIEKSDDHDISAVILIKTECRLPAGRADSNHRPAVIAGTCYPTASDGDDEGEVNHTWLHALVHIQPGQSIPVRKKTTGKWYDLFYISKKQDNQGKPTAEFRVVPKTQLDNFKRHVLNTPDARQSTSRA